MALGHRCPVDSSSDKAFIPLRLCMGREDWVGAKVAARSRAAVAVSFWADKSQVSRLGLQYAVDCGSSGAWRFVGREPRRGGPAVKRIPLCFPPLKLAKRSRALLRNSAASRHCYPRSQPRRPGTCRGATAKGWNISSTMSQRVVSHPHGRASRYCPTPLRSAAQAGFP